MLADILSMFSLFSSKLPLKLSIGRNLPIQKAGYTTAVQPALRYLL